MNKYLRKSWELLLSAIFVVILMVIIAVIGWAIVDRVVLH